MIVSFLLIGLGAALFGAHLRRGGRGRQIRALLGTVDTDAEIALHVANHAATSRGHALAPIHVLYGLLQDATFVAAITELGGNAAAIEDRALDDLESLDPEAIITDPDHPENATLAILTARVFARHHGRAAGCADLWQLLLRTEAAKRVELGGITPIALSFALIHGGNTPRATLPGETAVHVILRNDDFTTFEFVVAILREVFELADPTAHAVMLATHHEGRAVVGRFEAGVAKARVEAAWARARSQQFPLWIGVEAC